MAGKTGMPRSARCPHCGNSTRLDAGNAWRPFCSERCKLIDLGKWFEGRYALPAEEEAAAQAEGNPSDPNTH